jgi:PiT family inorganic phosphate transporter
MDSTYILVVFIILLALAFDYTNGFHDAANSIATVVSTRVLSPGKAVAMAAFFNFIAYFFAEHHVASTVGKGLVDLNLIDAWVILAGLFGAIAWNLITWYYGLPTSSSHALVGAYGGAAIAKAGFAAIIWNLSDWPKGWPGTLTFIVISPTLGLIFGTLLMVAVHWLFRNSAPSRVDRLFRYAQLFSSALFSFSHGTNDAQKTMGIMMAALIAGNMLPTTTAEPPTWVAFSAYLAIGLGTLSGGWRIIKTMGSKITKLQPMGGACAETGAGLAILIASQLGIAVSTTHTITGAIVGVGSTRRLSAVRWGVAGRIVWAWIITIPAASLIAALTYKLISLFH